MVNKLDMKQKEEVEKIVIDLISKKTGFDILDIGTEETLSQLGCDSLDAVEVLMGIENELDIQIMDELFDFTTPIGEIVKRVTEFYFNN